MEIVAYCTEKRKPFKWRFSSCVSWKTDPVSHLRYGAARALFSSGRYVFHCCVLIGRPSSRPVRSRGLARPSFERALEIAPESYVGSELLATVYYYLGDYKKPFVCAAKRLILLEPARRRSMKCGAIWAMLTGKMAIGRKLSPPIFGRQILQNETMCVAEYLWPIGPHAHIITPCSDISIRQP
jgi:hypothetical protein